MIRVIYILFIYLGVVTFGYSQITEEVIINVPTVRLPFNTSSHEFSPVQTDRGIAYVLFKQENKKDSPTRGERSFNIVVQTPHGPEMFAENLNTDFIEGPFAISKDKIYLTKSNVSEEGENLSKERAVKLKIFESNRKEGVWAKPEIIEFPSGDFNYCHPTINRNGDMMIFASDAAGGYGKMDLYFSFNREGKWTRPENLGPEINTEGNDWFPYFHNDQYLYFSSDAREESDDLDIYEAAFLDGEFKEVVKIADPINTEFDDFGLSINPEGTEILFSSARPGNGRDDIYQTKLLKSLNQKYIPDHVEFSIQLEDGDTGARLPGKEIKIIPVVLEDYGLSRFNELQILSNAKTVNTTSFVIRTDDQGEQVFKMSTKSKYTILVDIPGYKESRFIYDPVIEENEWIISMIPKEIKNDQPIRSLVTRPTVMPERVIIETVPEPASTVYIPTEIGSKFEFENIYYEYNSATIRPDAVGELEALYVAMLANPSMRVRLISHTDSRGKDEYNLDLSRQRARSAKLFLTRRGIATNRIITEGRGESEIRNRCTNGVNCTEQEHRYNRRTALEVLEN